MAAAKDSSKDPAGCKESEGEVKTNLVKELKAQKEWYRAAIYSNNGKIQASTFAPNELTDDEIKSLLAAYNDRDTTVGQGLLIGGQHYEVHRFYDDLIYGRRGEPSETTGFAICRTKKMVGTTEQVYYFLITYQSPTLSARAIPQLRHFAKNIVDGF